MKRAKTIGATPQQILDRIVAYYTSELGGIYRLQPADLDDLRQEGYLAAIEALASWDRSKGTVTTYLSPHVRGAMTLWLSRDNKHGMTGSAAIPEFMELEHDTDEREGLVDETADSMTWLPYISSDQVLDVLGSLPILQAALLSEYYGLHGGKSLTLRELASKRRVSLAVMRRRVDIALREANKLLLDRGVTVHDV